MKKLLLIVGMMMFVGGGVSPVFGEAEPGDRRCAMECNGDIVACENGCIITYLGLCTSIQCVDGGGELCCLGGNNTN